MKLKQTSDRVHLLVIAGEYKCADIFWNRSGDEAAWALTVKAYLATDRRSPVEDK